MKKKLLYIVISFVLVVAVIPAVDISQEGFYTSPISGEVTS